MGKTPWTLDGMPGGDYQFRHARGAVARISGPGATLFVRYFSPEWPSVVRELLGAMANYRDGVEADMDDLTDQGNRYALDEAEARARALLAKLPEEG